MTEEEKKKRAREYARRYYQAHKEEILAKQYVYKKKKYKEDPEYRKKVYENSRRWIEKNPEKAYAIKRKWQVEHRESTKDEIIERLQEEIMWLKDTIQDKNDCIGAYDCIIEDRDKQIDKASVEIIMKDIEIARLNKIIDEALRFIKLHDLYHPSNEFILLNILQGNDKKVDELTKAIIKAQKKELKEEGKNNERRKNRKNK